MALTLSQARAALSRRAGAWVALADEMGALAYSLASLSASPADPAALVDDDFTAIEGTQQPQLLDVAEWRVLEDARNNCDAATLKAVGIDMSVEDALSALDRRVDRLYMRVREQYGVGLGSLSFGTIGIDMATKGDDVTSTSGY